MWLFGLRSVPGDIVITNGGFALAIPRQPRANFQLERRQPFLSPHRRWMVAVDSFDGFGFHEKLIDGLHKLNYVRPTEVQVRNENNRLIIGNAAILYL